MCKVPSDETVSRAAAGDRDATELLLLANYDRVQNRISRELPQSLRSTVQVEDVVQDTFVEAIRSLPQCNADNQDSFAAWLETIAKHRVLDAIRHHNAQKRGRGWIQKAGARGSSWLDAVEMLTCESTPGRWASRREAAARIHEVVEGLPKEQRQVIQNRYLDDASIDDTAEVIGRSPAAVRGLLHRAKRTLREALQSSSRWFYKK